MLVAVRRTCRRDAGTATGVARPGANQVHAGPACRTTALRLRDIITRPVDHIRSPYLDDLDPDLRLGDKLTLRELRLAHEPVAGAPCSVTVSGAGGSRGWLPRVRRLPKGGRAELFRRREVAERHAVRSSRNWLLPDRNLSRSAMKSVPTDDSWRRFTQRVTLRRDTASMEYDGRWRRARETPQSEVDLGTSPLDDDATP